MKAIKKTFQVVALILFALVLASGPISLIICIITKNMLFMDIFLVYLVVAISIYCLVHLTNWAESLGKKG